MYDTLTQDPVGRTESAPRDGSVPGQAIGAYSGSRGGRRYQGLDDYTGSRAGASSAVNFNDASRALFGYGKQHEFWVPEGMKAGGQVKQKGCFITEAMAADGKTDDAYELEVLRAFRDDYMLQEPELKELVEEYEEIAPAVVREIRQREDADVLFRFIGSEYLKPAVKAIEEDELDEALRLYAAMLAFIQVFTD